MITPNRSTVPWAQREDWDKHRMVITDLYLNQGETLESVMQVMTEEYGFRATVKMYKMRFKKWGVAKNNLSKSVPLGKAGMERENDPAGSASRSPKTNQKSEKLMVAKMNRRRIANRASAPTPRDPWTRSVIKSMAPPDFYKGPEDAFRYTKLYYSTVLLPNLEPSTSGYGIVVWTPTVAEWVKYLTTARSLFALGYPRRAFMLVDMCFHRYRSILTSKDLSLPDLTVGAILSLFRFGTDLVEAFLNFAYKMSQIVLGKNHPQTILFHKLKAAGTENLVHCIVAARHHYAGRYIRVGSHASTECYGEYYSDLLHNKFADASLPLQELQPLQYHLQHHLQRHVQGQPESESNLAHIQAIQCRIAWLHLYSGRHEEATTLVLGILNEPLSDPRVISGCGCYDILYEIAVAENKQDLALDMLRKAVAMAVEGYGYAHCVTAKKMARLESYLQSMGCLEEADKVRIDSEFYLEQICGEVQRLRVQDAQFGLSINPPE
ncbi:Clr5 domain-containing protein [Ustulina deusta]|nr:Clr5 domain-containing protein [Ustulina deusta]